MSKHLTLRMDDQLFEEIEALKPEEISMSAWLLQYIERGRQRPENEYEERATREISMNAAVHGRLYEEMTQEERRNQTDSFRLSQGHITFNEIIEKHKEELEKKYK